MIVPLATLDGRRREPRLPLRSAGRLHRDGGIVADVTVVDLTRHGCSVADAGPLVPGSYVTLVLSDQAIIAGRIGWSNAGRTGIDFCQALSPKVLTALVAAGRRSGQDRVDQRIERHRRE